MSAVQYVAEDKSDTVSSMAREERRRQPLCSCVEVALAAFLAEVGDAAPSGLYDLVLAQVERPLLATVLRHTEQNQSRAAELLGINRSTLRRKLRQYGLLAR